MRKPPPLHGMPAGRSFTLDEQRSAGLAVQRAWRSDLRVASRGVRVPWGVEQDFTHTCRMLSGLCPSAACCLGTAGRLWRSPLPWSVQTDLRVHLARFDGGNRPVRKGVAGHRLDLLDTDVTELDGIPITNPARTWLDLAAILGLEDLVVAADFFICSQSRSFGPRKLESDIRRDESIAAIGWTSVTITASQVRTWGFGGCAQRVLDALVRLGGWGRRGLRPSGAGPTQARPGRAPAAPGGRTS